MARMTITVDERLVTEVKKTLGVSTKAEAIRVALQEVLRRKRLAEALEHRGGVELALDQETLEQLRQTP